MRVMLPSSPAFARTLLAGRRCDAMEIMVDNRACRPLVVRLRIAFQPADGTEDMPGYLSVRDEASKTIVPIVAIASGTPVEVTLPSGPSKLRLDFSASYEVSRLELLGSLDAQQTQLHFSNAILLGRDGTRLGLPLLSWEARTDTILQALRVCNKGKDMIQLERVRQLLEILQPVGFAASSASISVRRDALSELFGLLPHQAKGPALLSLLDDEKGIALTDEEALGVIAEICLWILRDQGWISTGSLVSFAAWLDTPAQVEALIERLNRVAKERDPASPGYVISKHSINPAWLLARKQAYIACMKAVLAFMQDAGIETVLAYGTLLGARRTGTFIPHDDDVDLLYWDGSLSRAEAVEKRDRLVAALVEGGFAAKVENGLFHIKIDHLGGSCDLFPSWQEGSEIHLLMEKYAIRGISREIVFPRRDSDVVHLYGDNYPAPREPDTFLAERYGIRWNVSDPYFEWPWPLSGG